MSQHCSWICGAIAAAIITVAGCGGGSDATPGPSPSPSPTPTPTPTPGATTITITSAGASPRAVTIAAGGRVTFVNNDNRPHEMTSNPHPAHTDCPAINDVGFLAVGQSKTTGNLTTVRTCGFHDHQQETVVALQGTITIQ